MSGAASVWNRAPAHGEGWRAAVLDERASLPVRCPVSSCGSMILVEEALERSVLVGIVGAGILPAVPDHIQPCAGENPDRVRVVVAAVAGPLVKVGGPGVGVAAVAGEVTNSVAEVFVTRPAEIDGAAFAGLSSGGGNTGQAGQGVGTGKAAAAIADLGQPGGADPSATGQAGEDLLV